MWQLVRCGCALRCDTEMLNPYCWLCMVGCIFPPQCALMSAYRKKLCLILRPLRESVDHFQHSSPFDQTPTTLPSFLTSLTSNVWHSRLAVDQLSTPRQGPTGPGQMPLHVGPDHMNVGWDWGPRRVAPPTCAASHHSLKINSRKDIKGHLDQRGILTAWVRQTRFWDKCNAGFRVRCDF